MIFASLVFFVSAVHQIIPVSLALLVVWQEASPRVKPPPSIN
ncbi:hypothetical protein B739_1464 [Riemerella anatipestifer RA-CH-1]|uniref:Uncharacterized protein n=1 Tax=Riemerella anatipestifer RA-CH-1 TaxID=1228997 RepID=J9R2J4_RIEAN|nr:hypothetical protein B739_1464 [Riemerella anatipestifer RA-CH-1]